MRPYLLPFLALLILASSACGITRYSTFEPPKRVGQSDNEILADDDLIQFKIRAICYSTGLGSISITIQNKTDRQLMVENLLVKSDLWIKSIDHRIPITEFTVLDHERPAPSGNHMVPEWYESFDKVPDQFRVITEKTASSKARRYSLSLGYDRLGLPIEKADAITMILDFDISNESIKRHYQLKHSLLRQPHHNFWVIRDD